MLTCVLAKMPVGANGTGTIANVDVTFNNVKTTMVQASICVGWYDPNFYNTAAKCSNDS